MKKPANGSPGIHSQSSALIDRQTASTKSIDGAVQSCANDHAALHAQRTSRIMNFNAHVIV